MTPEQIDRVFGRGRLRMVTGEHAEVFREAVAPGERRRYTKRFLKTTDGDFAHWTEREWRILARLIGHGISCVPDVVQFDRGSVAGIQLVQTYDAGVTVDQWATLLPLIRDGHVYRHAFEDCAHWWALAHHCLAALNEIHKLQLVHLDIKGDNVCIPLGPADFDPDAPELPLYPMFGQLALIDFAFALVSRETLTTPLPIGWQREYDYQSPRLLKALEDGRDGDLRATRELDWRCDMYSLAAMLKRYLPDEEMAHRPERATGWTSERYDAAKGLILTLREHHDRDAPLLHPHLELINATGARLRESELARSLATGWVLARDASVAPAGASPLTPMTRLAPSIRVFVTPRNRAAMNTQTTVVSPGEASVAVLTPKPNDAVVAKARRASGAYAALVSAAILSLTAVATLAFFPEATHTAVDDARKWLVSIGPRSDSVPSPGDSGKFANEPVAPGATSAGLAETAAITTAVPAASVTASGPESGAPSATTGSRVAEPTVQASAPASGSETSGGLPDRASDTAPRQALGRASPRPLPTTSEAARAAGRRAPPKSTMPPARSSRQVAALKLLPAVPPSSAGRSSLQTPRALPTTTGSHSRARPVRPSEPAPRVDPAPTQLAQLTAPGSEVAPSPSPTSPTKLPSAQATPMPSEPVNQEAKSLSVLESRPSSQPTTPSQPVRRERAASASEDRRTDGGLLSRLFRLAERTAAPIEDRRVQSVAPPEPASRAQQTPSVVQERLAQLSPTTDAPPSQEPKTSPSEESHATVSSAPAPRPPSRAVAESPAGYLSLARFRETDFAMQARRTLAQAVPQIAMQAQNEITRVLWAAAAAHDPRQERAVVDAAQAVSVRDDASGILQSIDPVEAQRLNKEAHQAYWVRRNISEAFDLQLKAFGANPRDPEIAGNLAFLHLKVNPLQPETARQLALHAIAMRGSRFRTGRLEDWNTYAIASALTGRNIDAKNALFVTVALARDVERNCIAARSAIAKYGERLREPAEAMLYRIYTQGRANESPYCAWPPNWAVGARLQ